MAYLWQSPPEAVEIMKQTANWVARLYGVKITLKIEDGKGDVSNVIVNRIKPEDQKKAA